MRVLTPSGGISAIELQFSRGQYVGSYRWTQPGLHTVSVSLEQEAVVGSPFTVEALAAGHYTRPLFQLNLSRHCVSSCYHLGPCTSPLCQPNLSRVQL